MRKNKGISQTDLANKVGVSKQTISGYENNVKIPSCDILVKIVKILNGSLDYLLGLDDTPSFKIPNLRPGEEKLIHDFIKVFHSDE